MHINAVIGRSRTQTDGATPLPDRRRERWRRCVLAVVAVAVAAMAVPMLVQPAAAWKPYTHNATAAKAFDDLTDTDDGAVGGYDVTIDGREYAVDPVIGDAIALFPEYYNAGVIGPDGFPDLAFGQSQIHPEQTGKWLRHLYTSAWNAYADTGRPLAERQQILAFTYGFMTHAAGDMWAHTLINKVADGVFPSVGDIVDPDDLTAAEIALRHVIAEGYVGDATPGYDGNDARAPAPGQNEDGVADVSDDSTPGFSYAAPKDFLYDTLVDPSAPLPVGTCGDGVDDDNDNVVDDGCPGGAFTLIDPEPNRGPVIDYFLDLQADLQIEKARYDFDAGFTDCLIVDPDCYAETRSINVQTVRGVATATVGVQACDFDNADFCLISPIDLADDAIVNSIGSAYMGAWIDDITTGLQHWSDFGLQLSKALFDAQTYRDAQNFFCRNEDGDNLDPASDRVGCEDAFGMGQVLLYTLGGLNGAGGPTGFIPDHLLSMLGAPDFVGDGFAFLGDAFTFLQDLLAAILPDIDIFDALIEEAKELLLDLLSEALGFDVELLETFLKNPTHWMNVQSATFELPFLGTAQVDLFQPGDRAYLDGVMGLVDPLVGDQVELPDGTVVPSSRLNDDAEWTLDDFETAYDSVQMSKLLLLDGDGLNEVIADQLDDEGVLEDGVAVGTYTDPAARPANVMIEPLSGTEPWLRSIDSDHAWRADRQPMFDGPDGEHGFAGNGQFPLWESCIARPAFRGLFRDWENGDWAVEGQNFPALGDTASADPSVSTNLQAQFEITGHQDIVDAKTWIGGDHEFVISASDDVFTQAATTIRYRTYPAGDPAPAFTEASGDDLTFTIPAGSADGAYTVEWQVETPCQLISQSEVVWLDTTPPAITIVEPSAPQYDTDDFSSIAFTIVEEGSGVAAELATLDNTSAANGQTLDMFTLVTGSHTVMVTATDHVGNTGTASRTFTLLATSVSLRNNIDRAQAEGLIPSPGAYAGLRGALDAAVKSHAKGQHATEVSQLGGVVNQLTAERGKGIDAAFADRMIGWVNDLIAAGG